MQDRDVTCGAVMLLHLGWRLGLWSSFSHRDVHEWYHMLRWGLPKPTLFGGGPDSSSDGAVEDILGNFLRGKGVPEQAIAGRISEACRTLGKHKIAEALNTKNPWQNLKALGNSRARPFLWVKYDELRQFIDQKGREKWGASVDIPRRKDFKKKVDQRRVEEILNPSSLILSENVFTDGTKPVAQIDFANVKSGATGVAFCRIEDAKPYLIDEKSISMCPLLLLILGHDDAVAKLKGIIVPATYRGTDEPILVHCSQLQLGDITVVEKGGPAPDVGTLPTKVFRLQVYRDEWEHSWDEFLQKPIRCLVSAVDALQLCREASCPQRCGKYHAAVEENGVESTLVDIWGWRWAKLDGKKCPAAEADSFAIFIRVPESGFDLLNEKCEVTGVYVEPRLLQGQGTDSNFAVIWIAQATGKQVRRLARTDDKILGVARLGERFGIRVRAQHAEELHQKHCPNKPFLKGAVTLIYRVEPLPPGTHRQGLADALKSYGWEIKPLQAARGSQGRAWEIGASCPPPQTTLKLSSGYVTITKVKENRIQRQEEQVVASQRTKQHIRRDQDQANSSTSPWGQDGDPWAAFLKNKGQAVGPPPNPPPGFDSRSKFDEVRESVLKEVSEKLQADIATYVNARDAEMPPADPQDDRLDRLENELVTLQHQGQKFEQWFVQAEEKSVAQSEQLGRVEAQLEQQSQFATRLAHTVEGCTQSLSTQQDMVQNLAVEVSGVKSHLDSTLDRFFARQTAQLESMLGKDDPRKKARNDDL